MRASLRFLLIVFFACVAVCDIRAEEISIRSKWDVLVLENDSKMAADKRVLTWKNISGSWGPSFEAFGPSSRLILTEADGVISGEGNSSGCMGVFPSIISGRREGNRIKLKMVTPYSDTYVTLIYDIVNYKGTVGLRFIQSDVYGSVFIPSHSYVALVSYSKHLELRAEFEAKLRGNLQTSGAAVSTQLVEPISDGPTQ